MKAKRGFTLEDTLANPSVIGKRVLGLIVSRIEERTSCGANTAPDVIRRAHQSLNICDLLYCCHRVNDPRSLERNCCSFHAYIIKQSIYSVKTSTPPDTTATISSKWALKEPSLVT